MVHRIFRRLASASTSANGMASVILKSRYKFSSASVRFFIHCRYSSGNILLGSGSDSAAWLRSITPCQSAGDDLGTRVCGARLPLRTRLRRGFFFAVRAVRRAATDADAVAPDSLKNRASLTGQASNRIRIRIKSLHIIKFGARRSHPQNQH